MDHQVKQLLHLGLEAHRLFHLGVGCAHGSILGWLGGGWGPATPFVVENGASELGAIGPISSPPETPRPICGMPASGQTRMAGGAFSAENRDMVVRLHPIAAIRALTGARRRSPARLAQRRLRRTPAPC
jgi:hypothetical protein